MKIFPITIARYRHFAAKPFLNGWHTIGRMYSNRESLKDVGGRPDQPNERIIEYGFVFSALRKVFPRTVLDVGPGLSSFPHLLLKCALDVTAVDNFSNYWGSSNFNRHFVLQDSRIENYKPGIKYDFIYCVSTLEHIPNSDDAIGAMFDLLNPGGHLALTIPYNETTYHPNIYKHPEATFGKHVNYICQIFSRREINNWLSKSNAIIIEQEYWKIYTGVMHTFGENIYPFIQADQDSTHQLTCVLFKKI
jgi:2-polyprenyl-3-methyl-5-hydroxy-6-metoxy-1,4-benzoquinol methylase